MAEALGLASNILAVIQITGQITTIGYGYIGGVKRAPKDLLNLVRELNSLTDILTTLQDHIGANPQSPALQALREKDGLLQGCIGDLEALKINIKPKNGSGMGIRERLKWPLNDTETVQHISRIERYKSGLSIALDGCLLAQASEIEVTVQKTYIGVQSLQTEFKTKRVQEESLLAGEERRKILNWIYSENTAVRHEEISRLRLKGTGTWLFKNPLFNELIHGNQDPSVFLWGYGIPGAGKTYLSSAVIDYLEELAETENYGVGYIYFNFTDQTKHQPVHILSSLVKQLARKGKLPLTIKNLYEDLIKEEKDPNMEQLYTAFLSVVQLYDRTFFVLDALDECCPGYQQNESLRLVHRMKKDGVRFFVTSREYPDIQESFRDMPRIELSANADDIRNYILEKIDENARTKRLVQRGQCQDQIISEIIDSSKGMFLLAHFHIQHICQQITVKQILIVLDQLRNSESTLGKNLLDPTYDRVMKNLHSQPDYNVMMAMKIFSWLIETYRTLTVPEIQVAIAIEHNRYELDEFDLLDEETILEICAGLVTIDQTSNTIRFVHYTVKDYLLANHLSHRDAQFQVLMACTTYLCFDVFSQGALESEEAILTQLKDNWLLAYVADYFPQHITSRSLQDEDESIWTDMLLKLLNRQGSLCWYAQISRLMDYDHNYTVENALAIATLYSKVQKIQPLHVGSFLGHVIVVQLLLFQGGVDVSDIDGGGFTALQYSAYNGQQAVVELLLANGADVLGQDDRGRTALHWAMLNGHQAVAQFLLANGANVSTFDISGRTPLHMAVSNGHKRLVELLLEHGASVLDADQDGLTALHLSAEHGYHEVVQLLLESGADVSVLDNQSLTALHWAAFDGPQSVVQLLLENGSDANVYDNFGNTSLHYAASNGHYGVVQSLLENGADVSAPDKCGRTPLHFAVLKGHKKVAKLIEQSCRE